VSAVAITPEKRAEPRAERGLSRRTELILYGLLILAALVVRLIDLGDRPYHHDESQVAYFSWVFLERGDYEYQPILHGPVMYYLTALTFLLVGDSDFTARLMPALLGTLIVALPFLLRGLIGRGAAFAAAVLLAFGPTFLYYSRFVREDIFISAINFGLLIAVFRFFDKPRPWGPPVIGALTAAAMATKEATYITLFVAGTFFIPAVLYQGRRAGGFKKGDLVRRLTSVGWVPWAYGLAAFCFVYTILFTVFLTNPPGLWDGIHDGLAYWLAQQDVGRGGEPWYFYFAVLTGHEWPVVLLAVAGVVAIARRPTTLGLFLIWSFAMSLAVYSWASERFAWLVMHPLLPLILLAAIGIQALLTLRMKQLRLLTLPLVLAGFGYLGYSSFLVNAEHRADPKEFLVTTQSSEDVKTVVERIKGVDGRVFRRTGNHVTITVDSSEGATYPWAWYFRDFPVGYIDMTNPSFQPDAQVLLMTETSRNRLLPTLPGYDGRRFRFRVWWVRDWTKKLDAGAWWDWWTRRETWNPIGGMPGWVYVRRDAAAS
jgi:uncharacterized protein (TIGR03663 family)